MVGTGPNITPGSILLNSTHTREDRIAGGGGGGGIYNQRLEVVRNGGQIERGGEVKGPAMGD